MAQEVRLTNSYFKYWDLFSAISPDGTALYAGWMEYIPPRWPSLVMKIDPRNGQVLIPPLWASPLTNDGSPPAVVVDQDGYLHVFMIDGPYWADLRYQKYDTSGSLFTKLTDQLLTIKGGAYYYPTVAFDGQDIYGAFFDSRGIPTGEIFFFKSEAVVRFRNLIPGQTGLIRWTNRIHPNAQMQGAFSSSNRGFLLLDGSGRRVPLSPDALFFLTLPLFSGNLDYSGQRETPLYIHPDIVRGTQFYGGFVVVAPGQERPVKHISPAYQGIIE